MAITSNCAEIIITNPQGSVSFNKLITTTELSPQKQFIQKTGFTLSKTVKMCRKHFGGI